MDLPHRPSEPRDAVDQQHEFQRLRKLFLWGVGAALLFTVAANVFIGKQMQMVQMQLPAQRDAVIRQAMEFQKRDEVLVRKFVARLQEFARTNVDFRPVLEPYRSALGAYFIPEIPTKMPAEKQKK